MSASVWDSRTSDFSVKPLYLSVDFEGRLQRPSPFLIRSVPGRERVQGAKGDKLEVVEIFYIGRYSRPFLWILTYGQVERIKHGKTFQNWHYIFSRQRFLLGCLEAFALSYYCCVVVISILESLLQPLTLACT